MNELVPDTDHTRQQRVGWLDLFDGQNYAHGHASLHECQRCKAWVADREGHTAWHRSVDTDQTADLAWRAGSWATVLSQLSQQLHTPRPDDSDNGP